MDDDDDDGPTTAETLASDNAQLERGMRRLSQENNALRAQLAESQDQVEALAALDGATADRAAWIADQVAAAAAIHERDALRVRLAAAEAHGACLRAAIEDVHVLNVAWQEEPLADPCVTLDRSIEITARALDATPAETLASVQRLWKAARAVVDKHAGVVNAGMARNEPDCATCALDAALAALAWVGPEIARSIRL